MIHCLWNRWSNFVQRHDIYCIYVNLYALEHAYHDMRWRPSHVTILAQGPLSLAHPSPRRLRNGKVSAPLAFDRDGVL